MEQAVATRSSDIWAGLPGQEAAVTQLRAAAGRPVHAYLFVGPAGSGARHAARVFAAALINDERALYGVHPDVVVVEREGASISVDQAREIARLGARSPIEGNRKVLILDDFHLVDEAAPALLKTLEEATESTVFVIVAESVPKELVTVASRCVRIDFATLTEDVVEDCLVAEGFPREKAAAAAGGAFGNLDRARLLVNDDAMIARRQLWLEAPTRLDGTGNAVAALTDEITTALDAAVGPLLDRQAREVRELEERIKANKLGVSPLKALETRHKREQRRLRTDEIRAGLATLAQQYRDRLAAAPNNAAAAQAQEALDAVQWASESLKFNPNETLLLYGLLMRCSRQTALRSAATR